jgi:hypothetical protein
MPQKRAPARSVAKTRSHNGFWIDHAAIGEDDYDWLASAERLTLWNVQVPPGFLARLAKLWWLDIRGGSARDLNFARGAGQLRYLAINQVRGMQDLSMVSEMLSLRYIDFYGLPKVTSLPSFSAHNSLEHASLGQMQGLSSVRGVLDAPKLRELQFNKRINFNPADVEEIASHPTLRRFRWFAEDVPDKVWVPVVERIGLPEVTTHFPEEWFGLSVSTG